MKSAQIAENFSFPVADGVVGTWGSLFGPPSVAFTVPGKPVGFVATGNRHWSKRSKKVWEYAGAVRKSLEKVYGNPHLSASKGNEVFVGTVAVFANGTHPDPENVHKLVKDAMFHKQPGGDKYTGGIYAPPMYDKNDPHVRVLVWHTTKPVLMTVKT